MIATVYVVVGHSAYLAITTTYGGVAYELPAELSAVYNAPILAWFRWMSGWVYGFHMPLFFMLSGAVLALRPMASFDDICRAKFRRLLIPYFVWGWCFMFPIKRAGNFYNNETLIAAMRGFLSGEDSGHLWFLTALFWCMIVFCGLYKILGRCCVQSGYVILLMAGIIQLTGGTYIPFDVPGLKKGLEYIFYFALGYQFECERRSYGKWNRKITVCSFLILWVIELLNKRFGILSGFFTIIIGAFFTYLLSDICARVFSKVTEHAAWRIIIRNLFYVYIFHDPLEYIVLRISMHYHWLSSAAGCVVYLVSRTVIIFGVGIILGEIVTKGKVMSGRIAVNNS